MGNRAIITTQKDYYEGGTYIYLHWNGGRDSVEAFLEYCKLRGFRSPETDGYGYARLTQVIANFMGADGLSIGIDKGNAYAAGEYCDNGVYVIEDWKIIERFHCYYEQNEHDLQEMLVLIDAAQPLNQQLGRGFLTAKEVNFDEVKVGNWIYDRDFSGTCTCNEVIGIGDGRIVNGTNTYGLPYICKYGSGDPENNINNYITTETVRVKR